MIRPDKPLINFYTPDDDLVKYDDYLKLSKYCDQLQLEKKELANQLGQYTKLVQEYQEVENAKEDINNG